MANYILVYKGGSPPTSEEEGAAVTQAWIDWLGGMGPTAVDPGNPFGPSMTVAPGGAVTEGAVSGLTGYSIISANSMDAAVQLAQGCPHLTAGATAVAGTIEVYEIFPM